MITEHRGDHRTAEGPANGRRHPCPINGCDWWLDAAPVTVGAAELADVFGPGVLQATTHHQQNQEIERRLQRHVGGHSAVQWVHTVQHIRQQRDTARALHAPDEDAWGSPVCRTCVDPDEEPTAWPCATAAALGAEARHALDPARRWTP